MCFILKSLVFKNVSFSSSNSSPDLGASVDPDVKIVVESFPVRVQVIISDASGKTILGGNRNEYNQDLNRKGEQNCLSTSCSPMIRKVVRTT